MTKKYRVITILAALVFGGALLRFYGISLQSLWCDEIVSWELSNRNPAAIMENQLQHPHPPVYLFVQYFVQKYIGNSEAVLRASAAAAGIFSILAVFLLGRRLYSSREGLMAAAFTTVSWYSVLYSQEARPYALLALAAIVVTYCWVPLLRSLDGRIPWSWRRAALYAASAFIACNIHFFGTFLVMVHAAAAVSYAALRRRHVAEVLSVYAALFVAYLPWLPVLAYSFNDIIPGMAWVPKPVPWDFARLLKLFFADSWAVLSAVAVACLVWLAGGIRRAVRDTTRGGFSAELSNPDLLLLFWLVVPFVVLYIKCTVSFSLYVQRYLIILMPAAYLLAARAVTRLPFKPLIQNLAAAGLAAVMLVHLAAVKRYYDPVPVKEQLREATAYVVEASRRYGDTTVVSYAGEENYFNYYFARNRSALRALSLPGKDRSPAPVMSIIEEHRPRYLWFMGDIYLKPSDDLLRFLQNRLRLVEHKSFHQADVWLFEDRAGGAAAPRIREAAYE